MPHQVHLLTPNVRDLGGVASLARLWLGSATKWDYVLIEVARTGDSSLQKLLRLLRAAVGVLAARGAIHANPSFRPNALLRDLSLMTLARLRGRSGRVVFIHGWDWNFAQRAGGSWFWCALMRAGLGGSTVVVLSRDMASYAARHGEPRIVRVLCAAIKAKDYQPLAHGDRDIDVLFMSRLVEGKGWEIVIRAILDLKRRGLAVRCCIAGDGPDRETAERLVKELKLSSLVDLPGYVEGDRKIELFHRSKLFVFPSTYGEGSPVVIAEAIASGCVVLASRDGGIPELVSSETGGILLDQLAPDRCADVIWSLLRDPSEIGARSRMAIEAGKKFDVDSHLEVFAEAYGLVPSSGLERE